MSGRGIPRMPLRRQPAGRRVYLLRAAGLVLAAAASAATYAVAGDAADSKVAVSNPDAQRGPILLTAGGGGPPAPPRGEAARDADGTLGPNELSELQRLLNDLDFHAGPADGIPGPRTRAGIAAFQRFAGLKADGEPTPMLLATVREHARTARSAGFRIAPAKPGDSTVQLDTARLPQAHETLSRRVAAALLRARSASVDPAVVQNLRRAQRTLQRRRLERVLDSDFFGAEAVPQPWRIAGEGFEPHRRLGMRAGGDEPGPVFGALQETWGGISAALGLSGATAEPAELYARRPFAGPFELTVGFRLAENAGRLTIGPYRGASSRKDGYRLVYAPEDGHRLALVRAENGRKTVIAARALPIRLNTGLLHELTWWGTADGRIELAIGETEMFSVRDERAGTAFDGLTIAVQNGGFSIAHVRLRGAPTGDRTAASR